MEEITKQVRRARRRMIWQQFIRFAPWVMFACLLVASIGLAIPKIRPFAFLESAEAQQNWIIAWLAGSTAVGLLVSALLTFAYRQSTLDAAIEIDRRFGLKERISSSLALTQTDRETQIGQALMSDAARRVTQIRIPERFGVRPRWYVMMPLVPAMVIGLLFLVENATSAQKKSAASESKKDDKKLVKKSTEELRKKIQEQRDKLEEKGLQEAKDLFNKLQATLDKQLGEKDKIDQKEALVKLNDLAKDLDKRREEIGGTEKLKQQLQQMKSFEKGPADRMAESFKQGNFKQAIDEAKKLSEKLAKGELTPEQQKQLANQLKQMDQKLKQLKESHEQAKKDLEEQIKKKMDQGDIAEAGKLQKQLEKLEKMDQQMDKVQKMAQKLEQAAQAADKGQPAEAAEKMAEMVSDLEQMAKDLDELEAIEDMMDQLAEAKDSMACENCDGQGCAQCRGKSGNRKSNQPGRGSTGEGQGQGDRPEERTDTGSYDTRVTGKPRAGEAVKSGFADGPNITGKSKDEVKTQVATSLSADPDPLPTQPLPKALRENVKQYFESYQAREKKTKE